MNLEDIRVNCIEKDLEIKKVKDRIIQRQRQIERLRNKQNKLEDNNWWGDAVIRPIMELVKVKFPQLNWDLERLVPMGMCNRVSVFARIEGDDETLVMIGFTPRGLDKGTVSFDKKQEERRDSLNNPNGFGIPSQEITDIEQLYSHIEEYLKE